MRTLSRFHLIAFVVSSAEMEDNSPFLNKQPCLQLQTATLAVRLDFFAIVLMHWVRFFSDFDIVQSQHAF